MYMNEVQYKQILIEVILMQLSIKKLVYSALMIAIVFVSTMAIAIPLPFGYVNLGDGAIYIASAILGPKLGFLAGAIGSSLADYSLSYVIYVIPTFFIKGAMGLISGIFFQKNKPLPGLLLSVVILVLGYYITEIILTGNLIAPLSSIPFNLSQGLIGAAVGLLFYRKFHGKSFFTK